MFSTGFRELIINSDASVSSAAGTVATTLDLTISPLGVFNNALLQGNNIADPLLGVPPNPTQQASVAAAAGAYTLTVPAVSAVAGEYFMVKVYTTYAGRLLADAYPERQTLVYQVMADVVDFGAAAAAAVYSHPFFDTPIELGDGSATTATFTFKAGYEGIGITAITVQRYTAAGVVSGAEAVYKVGSGIAEDTAPTEGVGLGKLLEASVRSAVGENQEYAPNEFGSDRPDVRGTYTTFTFEMTGNIEGWEEHEDVGRSVLNQSNASKNTKYILYVNEASAAASIALINAWMEDDPGA